MTIREGWQEEKIIRKKKSGEEREKGGKDISGKAGMEITRHPVHSSPASDSLGRQKVPLETRIKESIEKKKKREGESSEGP